MATVSPAGTTTTERPAFNAVIGALAILAVIALVYFIARGRTERPAPVAPTTERSSQQEVVPPPQ
jgi:hypothetical protein